MNTTVEKSPVWTPTNVQFLYKHQNGRYYVRTYANGKEKWTGLRTNLLSIAKNRMKEHTAAAERQRTSGSADDAIGRMTFGQGIVRYTKALEASAIRPNTKAYRKAGLKLVLRSWEGVETLNVRRITSKMVENWLADFKNDATPYVPKGAKKSARNSTGASMTTVKCALDAVRQVLDVAVEAGHIFANPARNSSVTDFAKRIFKAERRRKAEAGPVHLPSRVEFMQLVSAIRNAGASDCKAAADFVEFLAFSGARKTEAGNVHWSDIDFDRGTVHLRVTKNGESRYVPMTDEMRQLLGRLREERGNPTPTANVLKVKEAQGSINSACLKIGIPRITTHALRHLFGTTCLEAGIDAPTVAGWLGHKDNGALLLKVYSHIRQQHQADMIKKVRFGV